MDKYFHLTLHWACDYLFMMGLKLIHVGKRGYWEVGFRTDFVFIRYTRLDGVLGPILLTWFNFNPCMEWLHVPNKVRDEITYQFLNLTVQPLKLGNG